jgi:DNA-binding SARP family transcriptional activator
MADLGIHLLGEFHLTLGDEPLGTLRHPRRQALLAYLLLHREAPVARRRLAFLFWPDSDEEQALTNLRNLLFKLRQDLPNADRFLLGDTQTVQWRLDALYALDVAEFEAAAAGGLEAGSIETLQRAVALYRGDLLPNCYDDWIRPFQARLQQTAQQVLARLAELLEVRRELPKAISYARQLLQIDPLDEAACRMLMRLHAANGDPAGALRVYHRFARDLRRELGVEPANTTQAAYRRLLNAEDAAGTGQLLDETPLVGRQSEWQRLQTAWQTAADGKPQFLMLTGEAGTGKTRLAEELLAAAGRQGQVAAAAHCYAAEGALAYAPITTWLRAPALQRRLLGLDAALLTEVARLAPDLVAGRRDVPPPPPLTEMWQRRGLFDALARIMCVQGEPIVLLLDDAQWCDRDTLEWLHYLLRFDSHAPLLVLGTMRAEDAAANHALNAVAASLRQSGQFTELAVEPLHPEETALLADRLAGTALAPAQHARLHFESEGYPLFVVEMVRAGWAPGNQEPGSQGPEPQATWSQVPSGQERALPPKVLAVLQVRISQLSPDGREVAELAAAIGREFTYSVLAQACDQPEDTLVYSLDELWRRRIIREHGMDGYDFTHDKLRAVTYAGLSAARRRLLHRRIAAAIETAYAHALDSVCGQVAAQYELAGVSAQAIPYYLQAARAAQRVYANADAIRYDRHALDLWEQGGGDAQPLQSSNRAVAVDICEHLGDVLHYVGRYAEAEAAWQRVRVLAPAQDLLRHAHLARKMGNAQRERYDYDMALQWYEEAKRMVSDGTGELAGECPESWQQAWIQAALEQNLVYYWRGQVAESDELQRKLGPLVEQHGTAVQRGVYFQQMALTEFRRNGCRGSDSTVALTRQAVAAQIEAGNQASVPALQFMIGFQTLWCGRPQEAMEPILTGLTAAERNGDTSLQARCLTYLTVACRQCGQVEETRRYAAASLHAAQAANMAEYVGTAKANQAWLAWRAGDLGAVEELGSAAAAMWDTLPPGHASAPFQWLARLPLLDVALRTGQTARAVTHAQILLRPQMQVLPETVTALLAGAVEAAEQDEAAARAMLEEAVTAAQELRLL